MKHTIQTYTAALLSALEGKAPGVQSRILRNFVELVYKSRDQNKLGLILKAVAKKLRKSSGLKEVLIESAAPLTGEAKKEIADIFENKAVIKEFIKPELLAGMRIVVDDELLIDASAKRQLERLFS